MTIGMIVIMLCESLLILMGAFLIFSWISKTPFYPSSAAKLNKLIDSGEVDLPKEINFIDIGSGDGRMVLWAAKKGYRAEGIEFNPFLTLFSRFLLLINGVRKNAKILNKNFNEHDFSKYNLVYLYIFSEHMDKIKNQLFNDLQSGAVIITNTFKFSNIEPDKKIDRFNIYYVK